MIWQRKKGETTAPPRHMHITRNNSSNTISSLPTVPHIRPNKFPKRNIFKWQRQNGTMNFFLKYTPTMENVCICMYMGRWVDGCYCVMVWIVVESVVVAVILFCVCGWFWQEFFVIFLLGCCCVLHSVSSSIFGFIFRLTAVV